MFVISNFCQHVDAKSLKIWKIHAKKLQIWAILAKMFSIYFLCFFCKKTFKKITNFQNITIEWLKVMKTDFCKNLASLSKTTIKSLQFFYISSGYRLSKKLSHISVVQFNSKPKFNMVRGKMHNSSSRSKSPVLGQKGRQPIVRKTHTILTV